MQLLTMRLADISSDDFYILSYPRLPERYEGLAEKFPGLPLLVIDGECRVICGHDYRLLLGQRGETRSNVLQVDLGAVEGLLLNYNVLNCLFGLNLYEKLFFIKKILPLCSVADVQRRVELGFPLREPLCQRLDALLSEPLRLCLASGQLSLKAALKMAEMVEPDRLALSLIFQSCGFSESQQWQVVQALEEIAFREKKTIAAVLASAGLRSLLAAEMPQKKFMEALSALRYPACSRQEAEWEVWRKKMESGGGLSLSHGPFFAREEIRVTLTVKDRVAAEELLGKLKNG